MGIQTEPTVVTRPDITLHMIMLTSLGERLLSCCDVFGNVQYLFIACCEYGDE